MVGSRRNNVILTASTRDSNLSWFVSYLYKSDLVCLGDTEPFLRRNHKGLDELNGGNKLSIRGSVSCARRNRRIHWPFI